MLFDCSCESTKNLIDIAASKSITLKPKNGTPLAALVSSTTVVPIKDLTAALGEELKPIPNEVLQEQSDNSLHNGYTDEIALAAAQTVNKRIDIIRTTVIPVVKSITTSIVETLERAGINHNTLDVVRIGISDMVFISSFMEEVNKNKSNSYIAADKYFSEQPKSVTEIIELTKTGSKTVDEAMALCINKIGNDALFHMWESVFVDRSLCSLDNYSNLEQLFSHSNNGLENAIVVFQLAQALETNNKEAAKQYKESAAYYIVNYFNSYNKDIEAGRLIKNQSDGVIYVYTANYVPFLQKGGTVEMVIGAACTGGKYITCDSILENADLLVKEYKTIKGIKDLESKTKIRKVIKDQFYSEFYRSFSHELSDFEKSYFETHQSDKEQVVRKFDNLIGLITAESVRDIYRRVTEVICWSRFFYLDCHSMLVTIDQLCSEGMSAEEALTEATVKEICSYCASMVTV